MLFLFLGEDEIFLGILKFVVWFKVSCVWLDFRRVIEDVCDRFLKFLFFRILEWIVKCVLFIGDFVDFSEKFV